MSNIQKFYKLLILISSTFVITSFLSSFVNRYKYDFWNKNIVLKTLRIIKEISPPGIILEKTGGLGNQLFRYACCYTLAKKLNIPLYIDVSTRVLNTSLTNYASNSRPFILDNFNVPLNNAINKFTKLSSNESVHFYDQDFLKAKRKDLEKKFGFTDKFFYFDDYCQSEDFFKENQQEIKEMFIQNIEPSYTVARWLNLILEKEAISVAVHIRRGDFIGRGGSNAWVTPISFYATGIKMILEKFPDNKILFFIFSDSIEIVNIQLKNIFKEVSNINLFYVSCSNCTNSLEDFYLMTQCKHMICSNSTFSWWAAYLIKNKDKVIITPKFHPNSFEMYSKEEKEFKIKILYPKEWIIVDPF